MFKVVNKQWMPFHLMFCALLGFVTFLFGYFPLKYHSGFIGSWDDLPNEISGHLVDGKSLYVGNRTRVVLMVIDALRYDFVSSKYMPYTAQMIENQSACLYRATAEPPTVTMPRIKAMTTGSISNFIDVALNFGSSAVTEDNFLNQAKLNNKKMVFYGDDTWLRLFPDAFHRSEGTTSFYVSDYTQVDLNVTRNLPKELPSDPNGPDWDLMVLHYLGLDHIGHLEGPASSKVIPKMLEMDNVIKQIMEATSKWKDETVLMLCGDHGMKDSGSHGGATYSEVTVPLLLTQRKGCHDKYDRDINQIDLAPTMSYVLGIPIPRASTGQILLQVLGNGKQGDLTSKRALYALHYNTILNIDALSKMLGSTETLTKECYHQYSLAEKSFFDWLSDNQPSAKRAATLYQSALNNMARYLIKAVVEFDMFAIFLGIVILFMVFVLQILVMIISFQPRKLNEYTYSSSARGAVVLGRIVAFLFVYIVGMCLFYITCGITQTDSALCKLRPANFIAASVIVSTIATIVALISTAKNMLNEKSELKNLNIIELFLIFATIVQALTYGGTSFIEEEHQTWYFFWVTAEFLVLVYTGSVLVDYFRMKMENATEIQDKGALDEKMYRAGRWLLPQWVGMMLLHRFLRTLNQTGDKWAFLPDVGDWLNEEENKNILSPIAIISMISIGWMCIRNLDKANDLLKINTIVTIGATLCIFFYRVTTLSIGVPFRVPMFNEVSIVRLFWIFIFLMILIDLWSAREFIINHKKAGSSNKYKEYVKCDNYSYIGEKDDVYITQQRDSKKNFSEHPALQMFSLADTQHNDDNFIKMKIMSSRTNVFVNIMILVCSLFFRPHNLILVPSIYLTSRTVNKVLDHKLGSRLLRLDTAKGDNMSKNLFCKTMFHIWIGAVFYFYQGNSNSLASIDLSSGYIGLEDYIPVFVALQMGIHTYAGPLLAGLFLFVDCVRINKNYDDYLVHLKECVSTVSAMRIYPVLVYSIIATILRYHLFVWTVISPKLLYDFTLLYFSLSSMLTMIIMCWSVNLQVSFHSAVSSRSFGGKSSDDVGIAPKTQ